MPAWFEWPLLLAQLCVPQMEKSSAEIPWLNPNPQWPAELTKWYKMINSHCSEFSEMCPGFECQNIRHLLKWLLKDTMVSCNVEGTVTMVSSHWRWTSALSRWKDVGQSGKLRNTVPGPEWLNSYKKLIQAIHNAKFGHQLRKKQVFFFGVQMSSANY